MGPRIFKPLQTSKWRLQTHFWQLLLLTQAPPFPGTPVGRCTISSPSETLESPCASSRQGPICHPPSVPILGFVRMPWHTLSPILSGFGVCLSSCWAHSYEGNFGQLETHPILFRIPSDCLIYYLFIYCTFFSFYGYTCGIWKFPEPGAESEPQLQPMPQPWQRRILKPQIEARDQTSHPYGCYVRFIIH